MPSLGRYFDPPLEEDIFTAFRAFVEMCTRDLSDDTEPITQSLVGAGQLLIGDISGADTILANLPTTPPVLDHFAGAALVAPVQALMVALPLESLALPAASRWVAGSTEQSRVRDWLARHRARLIWNDPTAFTDSAASNLHARHARGR